MCTHSTKMQVETKEEMTTAIPTSAKQSNEVMKNKERLLFRKRCTC